MNTEEEARDELVVQTTQEMMVDVMHCIVTDSVQKVAAFENFLKDLRKVVAKEMSFFFCSRGGVSCHREGIIPRRVYDK